MWELEIFKERDRAWRENALARYVEREKNVRETKRNRKNKSDRDKQRQRETDRRRKRTKTETVKDKNDERQSGLKRQMQQEK